MHRGFKPDIWFRDCDCLDAGTCPRCGAVNSLHLGVCKACAWDVEDKERGLPGSDAS